MSLSYHPTNTAFAILGMLSIEPLSGYQISQMMNQSTKHFWMESDGQLYPALAKLTKAKMIICKSTKAPSQRGKKIYSITKEGSTELKNWLHKEPAKINVRNEAMLKLFFGANVKTEISLEHVEASRYQLKNLLRELSETKNRLSTDYKTSPHLPYWLLSVEYGISMAESKLKWCIHAINTLKKMR